MILRISSRRRGCIDVGGEAGPNHLICSTEVIPMNAITIDKLSPQTLKSIEERARAHNKSIEDEAAAILEQATNDAVRIDLRRRIVDRIAAMTPKGVVVKWFVEEERCGLARDVFREGSELTAPDLLLVEVANAMRNKVRAGQM